jgi:hypothetical protein
MPNISLLLEGDGDFQAVPLLLRTICNDLELFNVSILPKPKKAGTAAKLGQPGVLENFLKYASFENCDVILLVVDVDEGCPVEIARNFVARAQALHLEGNPRIAFAFLKPEFEVFFLFSLESLAAKFPADSIDVPPDFTTDDLEAKRDSKNRLSSFMPKGKIYKETRQQAKYVNHLDYDILRERCRCYQHLESAIRWIASAPDGERVYPVGE